MFAFLGLQEFNSKLSDFGLAKAGPTGDRTHVSTQVMGTQGYAAPEYAAKQCLSNEPKLRPKMSEVLTALEQLQSPKGISKLSHTEHRGISSPVAVSPMRHRSPLHMTPSASPLQAYQKSPRGR
ncbi:hypothetical protein HAX54_021437 [Datura stramonium]|uniref:Protein kinase domain-containing protein n=1 Tax=Datura stramonium TaxID=4076 RepID=A0ABS8UUP3_DATST|nr:hypothetical protein [Datura stramonium]